MDALIPGEPGGYVTVIQASFHLPKIAHDDDAIRYYRAGTRFVIGEKLRACRPSLPRSV